MKRKRITAITLVAATWLFWPALAVAQNVGIRVANPAYRLVVGGDANGNSIVQQDGNVLLSMGGDLNNGGWVKTISNHPLHLATNNSSSPAITIATNGYVGVGLNGDMPGYPIDIGGRIRLMHSNNTAGIYFDGTTLPTRSFFGTYSDDYVGWYGSGIGWNLLMNVVNGNTGIGTASPTARLDLNGSFRYRDAGAKTGAILASDDVSGNAGWQAPVAFRAEGSPDGSATTIPAASWTKLEFSGTTDYNQSLAYQPLASQFVAPVRGIYHFSAQTAWLNRRYSVGMGLDGTRNGITIPNLPRFSYVNGRIAHSGTWYTLYKANVELFDADIKLEAGDIIWLMVYRNASDQVSADPTKTWFAGRLITAY